MISLKEFREFVIPNLLVLPMVTHWILPSGLEDKFYISILGVLFYLPSIFFYFYILYYYKLRIPSKRKKVRSYISILLLLFVYVFVRSIGDGYSLVQYLNIILGNLTFIYLPLLFLLFPLDVVHADKTKYLMLFSLFFISLQIIIYGLGLLTYTSAAGVDLTADEYDIGGVFRVATTVGASTGSGLIVAMLSILILSFYKLRKFTKIAALSVSTIALFLTLSRGPILLWILFLLFYILRLFKTESFKNKVLVLIVFIGGFLIMDHYGVFMPFKERLDYKATSSTSDMSSGRWDLNNEAWSVLEQSDYIGVGSGKVFPEKHLSEILPKDHNVRMHNTYLVYLSELGLIGGFLVILFYILLLSKTSKNSNLLNWGLFLILVLNYNLEAVFVHSEYLGLVLFIAVQSQRWNIKDYGFEKLRLARL